MSHGFHVDGEGSDEASHSLSLSLSPHSNSVAGDPTLQVKGVAGYEGVEALPTKPEN
jgi:hypothetical protein